MLSFGLRPFISQAIHFDIRATRSAMAGELRSISTRIEHPLFAEAGTYVDEIVQPIGLMLLKVLGKNGLGFNLFPVQVYRDTLVEKRHALLEFLALAIDGSQPSVESALIAFNSLTNLEAEILQGDKKRFHIGLEHFDDRSFIS